MLSRGINRGLLHCIFGKRVLPDARVLSKHVQGAVRVLCAFWGNFRPRLATVLWYRLCYFPGCPAGTICKVGPYPFDGQGATSIPAGIRNLRVIDFPEAVVSQGINRALRSRIFANQMLSDARVLYTNVQGAVRILRAFFGRIRLPRATALWYPFR